jgi:hypothetical protein
MFHIIFVDFNTITAMQLMPTLKMSTQTQTTLGDATSSLVAISNLQGVQSSPPSECVVFFGV